MKTSRRCPKCESEDILRIPGWQGGYGSGNFIPIGWWAGDAKVERFVCGQCGFSEEWVETQDIAKVRTKYSDQPQS